MKPVIDTVFDPVIDWISQMRTYLSDASIPVSRSIDLGNIFAPYSLLGPQWQLLITTVFGLAFIYFVIFIVSNSVGLLERFRHTVKWW